MTAIAVANSQALDALARLDELLDLANVRMKLADSDEGPGLNPSQIDLMEQEYRKFLALQLLYPDADIVPCKIVDEMWHRHILDTAAYRQDCQAIFGRFLDHFPYFGMRGEEDARALHDAYADTLDRYRDAFGEPPEDTWVTIDASSRCKRTACKPQKCR
ncbi:MAG TPA: hypothetical protein VNN15_02170 [Solirubrobacterales bacterium]|nr:hypothetical protein [Solirubrobacterales bacterium]